jgi:cytidylate kinase
MPAITISRQYGSGERKIAARVCELLGYRLFDKWLIAQVAAEVGLSKNEIVDFSEEHYKVKNLLARMGEIFSVPSRRLVEVPVPASGLLEGPTLSVTQMDEKAAVALVNTAILAAYDMDFVVIIGRGSQMVLKDKPNVVHVRLEAPLETRIARVQKAERLSHEEARLLIEERDRAAAHYLEDYHKVQWDNPLLYHLILNTGKVEAEAAAQIIITAMLQV